MTDATGERPAAADAIPAGHAEGLAHRHEDTGRPRSPAAFEHLGDGGVGQEHRWQGKRGGPDHHAPRGRGVDRGQALDDLELGHRVGLRAAERLGQLEGQQSRVVERVDRGGWQRSRGFGSLGPLGHHRSDLLDGPEKRLPLRLAIGREARPLRQPVTPRRARASRTMSMSTTRASAAVRISRGNGMRTPWRRSPARTRTRKPSRSTDVIVASSAASPAKARTYATSAAPWSAFMCWMMPAAASASGSGAAARYVSAVTQSMAAKPPTKYTSI